MHVQVLDLAGLSLLDARPAGSGVAVEVRGVKRLRAVEVGYGMLSFKLTQGSYGDEWMTKFSFLGPSQRIEAPGEGARFELPARPPAGLATRTAGALAAPAAKLDIALGRDVWFIYIAPWRGELSLSLSKGELSASDGERSAFATVRVEGEKLSGVLMVYAPDRSAAKLVLERRLNTTYGTIKVDQVIAQAEPGASRSFEWSPARGPPQPLLVATKSFPDKSRVKQLLGALGLPVEDRRYMSGLLRADSVVADGGAIQYALRLVLARRWRRDLHDQAELAIRAI